MEKNMKNGMNTGSLGLCRVQGSGRMENQLDNKMQAGVYIGLGLRVPGF